MAHRPSKFLLNYIKEHGKFDFTEEEFDKVIEVMNFMTDMKNQEEINQFKEQITSEELQKVRKSICLKCEHYNFFEDDDSYSTCKLCGCNVDQKIARGNDRCPDNRWDLDKECLKTFMRNIIKHIDKKKDTFWIDLMSHEDFEQSLIDNYQKQQQEKKDE